MDSLSNHPELGVPSTLATCSLLFLCTCAYDFDAAFGEELQALDGAGRDASPGHVDSGADGPIHVVEAAPDADVIEHPVDQDIVEDCLNAQDDDNDGLVDCADPDCESGFVCVRVPPPGWE